MLVELQAQISFTNLSSFLGAGSKGSSELRPPHTGLSETEIVVAGALNRRIVMVAELL
jgi:hypothetical protein